MSRIIIFCGLPATGKTTLATSNVVQKVMDFLKKNNYAI